MSERISDALLDCIHGRWPHISNVARIAHELQQRRAADKYATRWHIGDCAANQVHAEPGESVPCTCGYDQLPEWLRGGR